MKEWNRYRDKNFGRHDFQIDLGLALVNYAITLEWVGEDERTGWMRKNSCVPCDCDKCYFCINGYTTGVANKQKKRKVEIVYANGVCIRTDDCVDH